MRPRVAVTAGLERRADGRERAGVNAAYADAVARAGGVPLLLAPLAGDVPPEDLLAAADALLLTGGDDLDPALWGEPRHRKATLIDPRRQRADLALAAAADARGMPVLGICLGAQEMAVARGGRIIQHLPDEPGARLDHGGAGRPRAMHAVAVEPGSRLARIVGAEPLQVNSTHHQAAREPGRGMRVVARSPDGVVEAFEDTDPRRFFLAVQWHPEDLADQPRHRALFEALVRAAGEFRG